LHPVGDLFELNVKLRCQKFKRLLLKMTSLVVLIILFMAIYAWF